MLSQQQIAHFHAFGFVVLRGLLDDAETAALTGEVAAALGEAFGGIGTDTDPAGSGGIRGDYLPLSVDRTPLSQALIADDPRLFQGSAELLGGTTVPTPPIATCFTSNAGWHTDQGPDLGGVKFLAHLERRTAGSGALRVVPGSHEPGFAQRVQAYWSRDPALQGFDGWPVPCVVLETEPGDVIAFDLHLFHSSVGGDKRLAWTVEYLPWPGLGDPERLRVVRDLVVDAAEFDHEGYDRQRWPTWREWTAGAPAVPSRQVAVQRLRLLGVLGAGGAEVSGAHGFDDDQATRRLLRSRPPRVALDWAGAALSGTVISARPLRGGTASAVHLLAVARTGGAVAQAVLRRYVRTELNAEEPDIAAREARALRVVEGLDLPTPLLLAVDPTGEQAGVPAVLMSRVAGRVDWWPRHLDPWLARLAGLLPPIHAVGLPPPGVIRPFAPYQQDSYDPPAWARRPAVWTRAVEWFHRPPPDGAGPGVFIHRDFHPGNVLWRRGRVTGVVDWASASIGPACVDVGHCRGNLFQYGLEVVDRFTALWERLAGACYNPWADVVTIIGFLDGLRDEPPADPERFAVEDTLARAVAELSGPF